MKTRRTLLTTVFSAVLTLAGATAHAAVVIPPGVCLPGVAAAATTGPHAASYNTVSMALGPKVVMLTTQLKAVVGQPTYAMLLATSSALAASITTTTPPIRKGRLVVTLPDGTVVVDTGKKSPPDPSCLLTGNSCNTYANFQSKAINENHNSRVSIFSAQQWPCGFAVESKLSTSTGKREDAVARRLGDHLDSTGTARLSITK